MNFDPTDIYQKKEELIRIAKRCFQTGLQTNAGGNISIKLKGIDAIVIKPSGIGFNECTHANLMIADFNGNTLHGTGKPSKDLDFHADCYKVRPDIGGIVHVHSPWATGWASANIEIPCLTVQTIEKLGKVPLIPLSEEGGPQSPKEISPVIQDPSIRAVCLANHGTIGFGKTLMDACYIAEIIEETAHIAFVKNGLMGFYGKESAPMPSLGVKSPSKPA